MGIRKGKENKSHLLRQIVSFPSLVVVITCCLLLQRFRWKNQVFGEERLCGNYICHQCLDGGVLMSTAEKNKKLLIGISFRHLLYLSNFRCQ